MTKLALTNPIAILMACIGLIVFAAVTTPRLPVDTFPELTPPVIVIGQVAPGLAAKDVEKAVTWRIERYVNGTPGVDHVESLSRNNFALIYVWLKWGTDMSAAQTLVQSLAQFAMAGAPKSLGLLPPFVLQYDPSNQPVCQVVITGEGYSGSQLYDYAQNVIEPRIEAIAGVASAPVDGGLPRQINVIVDQARAAARHLTAADVAEAVQQANALLPSGEFISSNFDANVYTNGVPLVAAAIGEGAVKVVNGRPVRIKDVARVEDGGMPPLQSVAVDGKDGVYLNVLRMPGGNTIDVVDAVKAAVERLDDLPPGVKAHVYFDQSTFVRTTYEGLRKEIVQALVLIALVIVIFLQSLRGTVIVALAIPLAFAITLIILYVTGQTLNAFTLGGLTLSMGLLVDASVVVIESIHRYQRSGASDAEAALDGTRAVALPMLASSLATVAVLLPVLLLTGLAKKLFSPLALTVAVSVFAAYIVSMAVTPVACRYFLHHSEHTGLAKRVQDMIDRLAGGYAATLSAVLPYRRTVLGAAAILVLVSGFAASRLPSTFFPEIDEAMDTIYVRFAPGMSVNEAGERLDAMAKRLSQELPEESVAMVVANAGMPQEQRSLLASPNVAPNTGFLRIAFKSTDERAISQQELATRARAILLRDFPGIEASQSPGGLVASVFANGYPAPIVVEVAGENLDALDEQAKAIAAVARTVGGVVDVRESLQTDYPEVRVEADRGKLALIGASMRSAAQTTLQATIGNINTPGVWMDASNGRAYYVVTHYDRKQVGDADTLSALPFHFGKNSRPVLLGAYSDVSQSVGPVAVERSKMSRVARVLMQTEGRDIGSASKELEEKLAANPSTRSIPFTFVGQVQLMRTTFAGLGLALGLAVMVVFMIMASQFKSVRLPLVILFTVPGTLVGIVVALLSAGQGLSITALMGMLMVIGIAVANGILMVSEANVRLATGVSPAEAVVGAARTRFVPIIMTSLATILGLVPTALALEHGSEANQPLALAVVGGLASSTLLSLFLVPLMFTLIAKPGSTMTS